MHPYQQPLFVRFIVYFNENEDYFECHEVLEEYWKSVPAFDKSHPLAAYILLATAMYHWRRGNIAGASRTMRKAQKNILTFSQTYLEQIDVTQLQQNITESLKRLKDFSAFRSFKLCITTPQLTELVASAARTMELLPANSDAVIHKHMLRDRTDILKEREEKKKGRDH